MARVRDAPSTCLPMGTPGDAARCQYQRDCLIFPSPASVWLSHARQVDTVDGPALLRVPAGSQPGDTLVIPKRGMPQLGGPSLRGDHFFKVSVRIPKRTRYIL